MVALIFENSPLCSRNLLSYYFEIHARSRDLRDKMFLGEGEKSLDRKEGNLDSSKEIF